MGLTIHYRGKFRDDASLMEMIDEVAEIVKIYDWKYTLFTEQFPTNPDSNDNLKNELYGILFTPPGSEPVHLTFLSDKRMCSILGLKAWGNSTEAEAEKYLCMLSTKTQFAGMETHKLIIHILKHISNKYLTGFSVLDEGKYWETGDEKLLQEIFSKYEAAFDIFEDALQNNPIRENESFEEYFNRLLSRLRKK